MLKNKPLSYYAFEMFYWCGVRLGEMLSLTPSDFDFERNTVTIKMPHFLCEEMQEYIGMLYEISGDERMFQVTKSYLHHEMDRGAKAADVKRIRIHDLRHSHISLLIEMGFSALAIADRVGHESIYITYRYAHLFPNKQTEMADKLDMERMESVTQTDNNTVIQFHMDKEFEPGRGGAGQPKGV